jgi:hypothetical protein
VNEITESSSEGRHVSRREALQWVLAASATVALMPTPALGQDAGAAKPYGMDPILNKTYKPGDFWPLTMDARQRRTSIALADAIIPADDKSPAASDVGVIEFIDEWISAPYKVQQEDRSHVLGILEYVESEAKKRFQTSFADLSTEQQSKILDEIAYYRDAPEAIKGHAGDFNLFRNLVMGGFYTTPKGMKDVGYVGNTPLKKFDGPPKEVLEKLGLA